jgi:hypothetical protein
MAFTRSEINKRYNAKNKDKICENAIVKYNINKDEVNRKRRERYAEKKAQSIIHSEAGVLDRQIKDMEIRHILELTDLHHERELLRSRVAR